MLVVAALGQSALVSPDVPALEARIRRVAKALAPIARSHRLVITHSATARLLHTDAKLPLDLQAAQAAGLVGHLLAMELRNLLHGVSVVSLLAQEVVPGDHASGRTESIGTAPAELAPCQIVELPLLRLLAEREQLVLCAGCVPVQLDALGALRTTDVRIDHDQAATTLAIELGADILLLLTDVPAVYARWPGTDEPLARFEPQQPLPESIEAATMGSKLRAACRFAGTPGTFAVIGAADAAEDLVAGRAGTCVARSSSP